MKLRSFTSVSDRRTALAKELSINLKHTGTYSLDETVASTRNCENMIGAIQIPVGVAGPLSFSSAAMKSGHKKEYYVPLATTEGALVASVNRGCKALSDSGGAMVDSHRVGATRGPVFRVHSLTESRMLAVFLEKNFADLKRIAESTSSHLMLKKIKTRSVGRYRYVRFIFDTQDAMGLNMVTIATDALASYVKEKTGISCLALSGNFCVDKKPSWLNMIDGRGIKVWAEILLPARVLQTILKTTARRAHEVWFAKCMMGSIMSGSMAFNAQYANVVAGIFAATGQDLAHVVEGSLGITSTEVMGDDLWVGIYLPDLMVGTVGGGTGLATQQEALSMLGVAGSSPAKEEGKNAQRFAEIIGAAVLAGEISLLSSLEEGTLAEAHKHLARGGV